MSSGQLVECPDSRFYENFLEKVHHFGSIEISDPDEGAALDLGGRMIPRHFHQQGKGHFLLQLREGEYRVPAQFQVLVLVVLAAAAARLLWSVFA